MLWDVVKVAIAVAAFVVMLRIAIGVLRSFARPLPPPPPPGEMRKVNVRYRCGVCGAEVRMVLAAESDPPPPRHCQEDMDLVAPID